MLRLLGLVVVSVAVSGLAPAVSVDVHGVTHAGGQPIADAVVWLDAPNAPRRAQPAEVVLDQRNMTFYPHVLVVQVGTVVKFPNDDRVFHDVFSFHDGQKFNLGLYPVGAVKNVKFDKPGLSRIFCNIHPQMAAYVMVVDSPYFAVSDAGGRFTIPGVISETYVSHAWRPGGATLTDSIVVGAGRPLQVVWP